MRGLTGVAGMAGVAGVAGGVDQLLLWLDPVWRTPVEKTIVKAGKLFHLLQFPFGTEKYWTPQKI